MIPGTYKKCNQRPWADRHLPLPWWTKALLILTYSNEVSFLFSFLLPLWCWYFSIWGFLSPAAVSISVTLWGSVSVTPTSGCGRGHVHSARDPVIFNCHLQVLGKTTPQPLCQWPSLLYVYGSSMTNSAVPLDNCPSPKTPATTLALSTGKGRKVFVNLS